MSTYIPESGDASHVGVWSQSDMFKRRLGLGSRYGTIGGVLNGKAVALDPLASHSLFNAGLIRDVVDAEGGRGYQKSYDKAGNETVSTENGYAQTIYLPQYAGDRTAGLDQMRKAMWWQGSKREQQALAGFLFGSVNLGGKKVTQSFNAKAGVQTFSRDGRQLRWGDVDPRGVTGHGVDELVEMAASNRPVVGGHQVNWMEGKDDSTLAKGSFKRNVNETAYVSESAEDMSSLAAEKLKKKIENGGSEDVKTEETRQKDENQAHKEEMTFRKEQLAEEKKQAQQTRAMISVITLLNRSMGSMGKDMQGFSKSFSGGFQGWNIGSSFGPWGAAIGAVVGAIPGLVEAADYLSHTSERMTQSLGVQAGSIASQYASVDVAAKAGNVSTGVKGALLKAAGREAGLTDKDLMAAVANIRKMQFDNSGSGVKLLQQMSGNLGNIDKFSSDKDVFRVLVESSRQILKMDHSDPNRQNRYDAARKLGLSDQMINALAMSDATPTDADVKYAEKTEGANESAREQQSYTSAVNQIITDRASAIQKVKQIYNAKTAGGKRTMSAQEAKKIAEENNLHDVAEQIQWYQNVNWGQKWITKSVLGDALYASEQVFSHQPTDEEGNVTEGEVDFDTKQRYGVALGVGTAKTVAGQLAKMSTVLKSRSLDKESWSSVLHGDITYEELGGIINEMYDALSTVSTINPGSLSDDKYTAKEVAAFSSILRDIRKSKGQKSEANPFEIFVAQTRFGHLDKNLFDESKDPELKELKKRVLQYYNSDINMFNRFDTTSISDQETKNDGADEEMDWFTWISESVKNKTRKGFAETAKGNSEGADEAAESGNAAEPTLRSHGGTGDAGEASTNVTSVNKEKREVVAELKVTVEEKNPTAVASAVAAAISNSEIMKELKMTFSNALVENAPGSGRYSA